MLNVQEKQVRLGVAEERFIEDMGSLMMTYRVPRTTGRVLGYLLLQPEPRDLDRMARELGASKSGVSVAARQLESWALARHRGQKGSRRVLYEAVDDLDFVYRTRQAETATFRDMFRRGVTVAGPGPAAERLQSLTQLMEESISIMEEVRRRLAATRRQT
ncbi:MAG: ArsR family transcriptional regulator [Candidatus Dormibacteraeota bacterium]|nr:ArsR family transcriptional regulator [Candidatus Dormibacteraeota bacterium]